MELAALNDFFARSVQAWPDAKARYDALAGVLTRQLEVDGFTFILQHNPSRAVSTNARLDKASIAARPCFLCAHHRPSVQQSIAMLEGRYELLVNPFPILSPHFTIPSVEHTPQTIIGRLEDMKRLALELPGMAVFYNGPEAGASAPDHFHFQAVPIWSLPLLGHSDAAPFKVTDVGDEKMLNPEPRMNLIAWSDAGVVRIMMIPRRAHRPRCFFDDSYHISPGTIDMAGVIVLPRREDFDKLTADTLSGILKEVSYER